MGDTGVGPEEDRVPLGLTRMSKIAMRRSAHLGEVQHEAAHASFSELRRTPDLAIEGLDGAVEQACERVMERAARIGREAGLEAGIQGAPTWTPVCKDAVHCGSVREALAVARARHIALLARIGTIGGSLHEEMVVRRPR